MKQLQMKSNESKAGRKRAIQKIESYGKHPYTRILNDTIRDQRLGAAARGILCYALSHSDHWQVYSWQLQKEFGCGKTAIRSAMKQLVKAGYARLDFVPKPDGTLGGQAWRIRESPTMEWNDCNGGNAFAVHRETENQPLGTERPVFRRSENQPHKERRSIKNEKKRKELRTKESTRHNSASLRHDDVGIKGMEFVSEEHQLSIDYFNAKLQPLGYLPVTKISPQLEHAFETFSGDDICELVDDVIQIPENINIPKRKTLVRLLRDNQ